MIWSSISFPEDVSELLLDLENDVSGDSDDEDIWKMTWTLRLKMTLSFDF